MTSHGHVIDDDVVIGCAIRTLGSLKNSSQSSTQFKKKYGGLIDELLQPVTLVLFSV